METELILADHTIAEKRLQKLELAVKKINKDEDKKDLETPAEVPERAREGKSAPEPRIRRAS